METNIILFILFKEKEMNVYENGDFKLYLFEKNNLFELIIYHKDEMIKTLEDFSSTNLIFQGVKFIEALI
jgi:hypothetical protein